MMKWAAVQVHNKFQASTSVASVYIYIYIYIHVASLRPQAFPVYVMGTRLGHSLTEPGYMYVYTYTESIQWKLAITVTHWIKNHRLYVQRGGCFIEREICGFESLNLNNNIYALQ